MAKNAGPNTQIPVDRPLITAPGVVHRERDFFAQDGATNERRGFVRDQLDGSSAVGRANGNQGNTPWSLAQPLTGSGPFANLRGGSR